MAKRKKSNADPLEAIFVLSKKRVKKTKRLIPLDELKFPTNCSHFLPTNLDDFEQNQFQLVHQNFESPKLTSTVAFISNIIS